MLSDILKMLKRRHLCLLTVVVMILTSFSVSASTNPINDGNDSPISTYKYLGQQCTASRSISIEHSIAIEEYAGNKWTVFNIPNSFYKNSPGDAKIPIVYESLMLPNKLLRIEVILNNPLCINSIDLAPIQYPEILGDGFVRSEITDWSFYATKHFEPEKNYNVNLVGIAHEMGKQKFIYSLYLYPLKYNPSLRTVILYKECSYKVWCEAGEILDAPIASGSYIGYATISPSSALGDLQPLIDWKTKKGLRAQSFDTTYVYSVASGKDNSEKVHNFIHDLVINNGTRYVLLVGEASDVPARNCAHYVAESDCPADGYYMCIDGTWDKNGNGKYGEIGDIDDAIPDVAVGRIATTTVASWVKDTLDYEKNPVRGSWPTVATIIGPNCGANGDPSDDLIYFWDHYLKDSHKYLNKYVHSVMDVTPSVLSDAINNGTGFMTTIHHGYPNGWQVDGGSYDPSDVTSLSNGLKKVFIFCMSCSTNRWDDDECMGEAFTETSGRGAIGYIGSSRTAFGALDMSYGPDSIGMEEDYSRMMGRTATDINMLHSGLAFKEAKMNFAKNFNVDSNDNALSAWNQFDFMGDPEVPVWTLDPLEFNVTGLCMGNTFDATVKSKTGALVQNATVCLMRTVDTFYVVGETDSNGKCSLLIPPGSPPGDTDLIVTRPNYVPYETKVNVTSESVILEQPNGGETLTGGSDYAITWRIFGMKFPVKFDLSLSTDSGSTWSDVVKDLNNLTSYTWNVPKLNTYTARIKIKATDSGSKVLEDTSNSDFTIKTPHEILLLKPNGGELLSGGGSYEVTWQTKGGTSLKIDLFYTIDNDTSYNVIDHDKTDTGKYTWTLPMIDSNTVKVRASAVNLVNDRINDTSDSNFAIDSNAPAVTVVNPPSGALWREGMHKISWNVVEVVGLSPNSVNISYSTDDGITWNTLASDRDSSMTSYDWLIPMSIKETTTGRIKVSAFDKLGKMGNRTSEMFTIDTKDPQITHTKLQNSVTGSPLLVTATVTDTIWVQSVTLFYTDIGGSTFTQVSMSPSGSNYTASIPSPTIEGELKYHIIATDSVGHWAIEPKTPQPPSNDNNYTVKIKDVTKTGSISGTVIDIDGNAILGAVITAKKSGITIDSVSTDNNGYYQIKALEPGNYDLNANASGYQDGELTGVAVIAYEDNPGNDFTLSPYQSPDKRSITGKVVDSKTLVGIDGASVVLSILGKVKATKNTLPDGRFNFFNIEPGTYTLNISKSGYDRKSEQVSVDASDKHNIEIRLTISGQTVDKKDEEKILGMNLSIFGILIAVGLVSIIIMTVIGAAAARKRKKKQEPRFALPYPYSQHNLQNYLETGNFQQSVYPQQYPQQYQTLESSQEAVQAEYQAPQQGPPSAYSQPQGYGYAPAPIVTPQPPPQTGGEKLCKRCGKPNEKWKISCSYCKAGLG